MKRCKIIAKTEAGAKAIKQHYKESFKLRLVHKIQFKAMGYKQIIEKLNPYTLVIEITNNYFQMVLDPNDFKKKVKTALKENGAKNNTDYIIKIE